MAHESVPHRPHVVDTIIVGAGPVGLFLATKLGRAGHSVIVVEKHEAHYPRPRAVTFDNEIARALSEIGIDADHNPQVEASDDWYVLRNADREIISRIDWRGVTTNGWNRTYWFHQPELEVQLAELALETGNVTLIRDWEAESLLQDEDTVTLIGKQRGPNTTYQREAIIGRYLVGADGANSTVREALGLEFTDLGFHFDWLICDIIPHDPDALDPMIWDPPVWQLCDPARPSTVVPGGPGRRRWEFMALPGEDLDTLNTPEKAWELLEPWGVTPETATLERHVVWRFEAKYASQWQLGRAFIAGDAAHLMPPFAGQGMCAGIRDAVNLAWRLDMVLKETATPGLLEAYGPERQGHVHHFILDSVEIGRAVCMLDPAEAAARDEAMRSQMLDPDADLDHGEPLKLGPGNWMGENQHAGAQSHQGWVEVDGVTGRFDEVIGTGWLLLGDGHDPLEVLSKSTRENFTTVGGRGVSVGASGAKDLYGIYRAWFDEMNVDTVLIRPDHYVAAVCQRDEAEATVSHILEAVGVNVPQLDVKV